MQENNKLTGVLSFTFRLDSIEMKIASQDGILNPVAYLFSKSKTVETQRER